MGMNQDAAARLRGLRRERGESLRRAAQEVGVAPSQLSRMERGQRSIAGSAERLADYYAVPVNLLQDEPEAVPRDIADILNRHPEIIQSLREQYSR